MGEYAPFEPDVARLDRARPRVRVARPGDAHRIATLYADRHGRERADVEPDVAAEIARQGAGGGDTGRVFVAVVGDEVTGYGRVRRVVPGRDGQPSELPEGWYLMGVIVDPAWRRRGIAGALGRHRLDWIAARDRAAYCFSNRRNRAALALHRSLGFEPVDVAFAHERAGLARGEGRLLRRDLDRPPDFP